MHQTVLALEGFAYECCNLLQPSNGTTAVVFLLVYEAATRCTLDTAAMHCLAGKVQRLEETKRMQIEEITDLSAQVLAGPT